MAVNGVLVTSQRNSVIRPMPRVRRTFLESTCKNMCWLLKRIFGTENKRANDVSLDHYLN